MAFFVGAAGQAAAHKLRIFAAAVGAEAQGKVYFVGAGPAAGVTVTLTDAGGADLGAVATGSDGTFRIALPKRAGLTLTADARDGHLARFALDGPPAAGEASTTGEAPAPTSADAAALELAIARQLAPLAAQVDSLEQALRARDVIGAIGYIFGLFGLGAIWLYRRGPR